MKQIPPIKLLILNYEYPPLGGGAGIISKKLAEEFSVIGLKVTVLTTWFKGQQEITERENLTIIRLKCYRKRTDRSNPIEMYAWMKNALRYCKENVKAGDFDICQANFSLPGGPVALYLKKQFNVPYIILSHGHDIPWYFPRQMFVWHFLMYYPIRKMCLNSTYNVLLTEDMKQIADEFVGSKYAEKNVIIHNGLEINEVDWHLKEEKLNIIFAGRMVSQKDPVQFVEAANLVNNMKIPVQFKMFGDGPLMDKVKDKIDQYGLENVLLFGKVAHGEVIRQMKKSHIMIAPSLHEAMSVSVLEAISCGVYVITTPVSGNRQLIIDDLNGKLVPYNDQKAIAHEVKHFYDNKFTNIEEHIPAVYYEEFNRSYSWPSVVEKYVDLFNKILVK